MTKTLVKGSWYTVTTASTCTITDANGTTLGTAEAGKQFSFQATTELITFSDASATVLANPKQAPAAASSGGGVTIQFDTNPTSGSTNAVTSGGLYNVIFARELALGQATATGNSTIAVGNYASASNVASTAIGSNAKASHVGAMALGNACQSSQWHAIAIGSFVKVRDNSAICLGSLAVNAANQDTGMYTYFYILPAGSTLAETYEGGEACLGYVVKDSSGNISACGTRKLSELLTNNTAFAPAAMDLDAPTTTPFLPTGITDPIEMEELTD